MALFTGLDHSFHILPNITFHRRIILNGFAIYTTWTVIASLINLVQAIGYVPNSGPILSEDEVMNTFDRNKQGSYAALSLLFILDVTYFVIENVFFDSICRSCIFKISYQFLNFYLILDGS